MEFTYKGYLDLIDLLAEMGYEFTDYHDFAQVERPVILRHDVDMSLDKALIFARLENSKSIGSTYFVLLSTNFYNVFSRESGDVLQEITALGHTIGLHFDEKRYPIQEQDDLKKFVNYERGILANALGLDINVVSMHRPSKWILENDVCFEGLVNSYSKTFLQDFKYLSDSRMHWREDVTSIAKNRHSDKLHILTHPFWYSEANGQIRGRLEDFIRNAVMERYYNVKDNLRDLEDIIKVEELQ